MNGHSRSEVMEVITCRSPIWCWMDTWRDLEEVRIWPLQLFTHDWPPINCWDNVFELNWVSLTKPIDRHISAVDRKSTILFFEKIW